MMKQYPYQICYTMKSTGNRHHYKMYEASCQSEAKKLFEADMPSCKYICAVAQPQNRRN